MSSHSFYRAAKKNQGNHLDVVHRDVYWSQYIEIVKFVGDADKESRNENKLTAAKQMEIKRLPDLKHRMTQLSEL